VPVENEINKKYKIMNRSDVLDRADRGIKWYNDECRSIVQLYVKEWRHMTNRLGRWIDFDNDYKTMDRNFMESVWSVFKRLDEMNYVYRGVRVMPCSTALGTPMSKHEVGPETYKLAIDPAVVVSFPIVNDTAEFVAWTTTPWTLPSNVALCVSPSLPYVRVLDKSKHAHRAGRTWVMAEARLSELFRNKDEYEIIGPSFLGATLVGTRYTPLFDYFEERSHGRYFSVYADGYVTADSGTGVVHLAPGFGEDDFRVCLAVKLFELGGADPIPCPVDDEGLFMSDFADLKGKHVKDTKTNDEICDMIKAKRRLLSKGTVTHSVPHCSRSQTPLIYRAVPSWFIRVESEASAGQGALRDVMLQANKPVGWVPENVGAGRFQQWLAQARDWNVSRNRFWGTPIPIWQSEDGSERVTVGSVDELERLSGRAFDDVHRQFVDDVTIPSRKPGGAPLRRVPEVFDCWFESGSMPYAQSHFIVPPTGPAQAPTGFPADFIAEGLDQTRGWFYTLMVLSCAIYGQSPFKNVIVNGLVLAADGKKMSKSLRNFPAPEDVINRHGADALRMYLMNSPVVRAEPLRFVEDGVQAVLRDVFIPWLNALRFFVQNAQRMGAPGWDCTQASARAAASGNVMDVWIRAELKDLVRFVRQEMAVYHLYSVMPRLVRFVDQLTNWYVRLNRNRLRGAEGDSEASAALSTLFETLLELCSLMAPFTPFFTEYQYQCLVPPGSQRRTVESVHFTAIPEAPELSAAEGLVLRKVRAMQRAVQLGRLARGDLAMKKPMQAVVVVTDDAELRGDLSELAEYIKEELNVFELEAAGNASAWGAMSLECVHGVIGKRLKGAYDAAKALVEAHANPAALVAELEASGKVVLANGAELLPGDVAIKRTFLGDASRYLVASHPDLMVCLDRTESQALRDCGLARELKSMVQKLRKSALLVPEDKVVVYLDAAADSPLRAVVRSQDARVQAALGLHVRDVADKSPLAVVLGRAEDEIGGSKVAVVVTRPWVKAAAGDEAFEALLNAMGAAALRDRNELTVVVDGASRVLKGFAVVGA